MTYQDINDILHFNWGMSTTLSFKTSDLKFKNCKNKEKQHSKEKIKVSVERFIKKSKMKTDISLYKELNNMYPGYHFKDNQCDSSFFV